MENMQLSGVQNDAISKENRSVIEAFRYGIVPNRSIREWTFGREKEIGEIFKWLNDAGKGSLVIEGGYGSGKTHLLRYIYDEAIKSRFAVSMSSINPADSPIAFPKRIYKNIARNIHYCGKNGLGDFRNMLTEASENLERMDDHRIIGPILDRIKKNKMDESLWQYIFGLETRRFEETLPSLPDHTTCANVYCYLLSGIAWMCVNLLNQNGLLILFDEMELAGSYRYSYEWKRGLNFLDGISKTAFDEDGLTDEKIIKKDNLFRGERTDLIYSGFTKVPYSYKNPSFIKVVSAITPNFITNFGTFHYNQIIQLQSLKNEDLRKFLVKLIDAYIDLYRIHLAPLERRWLFEYIMLRDEINIRETIKRFVEVLDFKRYNPRCDIKEVVKFE